MTKNEIKSRQTLRNRVSMGKKSNILLIIAIFFLLTACKTAGVETKTSNNSIRVPDIVFFNIIDYSDVHDDGEEQCTITFFDNKGNYYTSADLYVCSLNIDILVKEYAKGKINDRIQYHATCNGNKLVENYNKLVELSANDEFKLSYPEIGPDVQAIKEEWYGVYYDKERNIQKLKIHSEDAHGGSNSNDERANEIYEWYISAFK